MREGRQPATSPTQPPNLILPICAMLVPIGLPFIIVNFYLKRIILARKCIFGILNIFIILLFLFYNQSLGWKTKTFVYFVSYPISVHPPPPHSPVYICVCDLSGILLLRLWLVPLQTKNRSINISSFYLQNNASNNNKRLFGQHSSIRKCDNLSIYMYFIYIYV